MAFRFPLKALWRVRSIYERRERQRLEVLTQHLVYAQKQLATLRQGQLEHAGSLAKSLKEGMTGSDLQFQVVCLTVCERRINSAAQVVEDLNKQHKLQLAKYNQARQKKEAIERLYERQLSTFRRTQARRDQQQATDLFLICTQPANDGQ